MSIRSGQASRIYAPTQDAARSCGGAFKTGVSSATTAAGHRSEWRRRRPRDAMRDAITCDLEVSST
ncbi:MAG: hypothetical protein ACRDKT_11170 [Actinomycetota bacterium]